MRSRLAIEPTRGSHRFAVTGLIALALLAPASTGVAQVAEAASMQLSPAERYVLPNGLEVILQPDHHSALVGVVVCYRAGDLADPEGLSGLAHLAEHMAFRGSLHVHGDQFFSLPQRWGATQVEAFTSADSTIYQMMVPARQLPRALWLESERMAFVLGALSAKHLELETRIVRGEVRLRRGTRYRVPGLLRRLTFPAGHPMQRFDTGGSEADEVPDVDLPTLQWFYQRVYRPDNAILALVGDFDETHAKQDIERFFGPIRSPQGAPLSVHVKPVEFRGEQRVRIVAPANTDILTMMWTLPAGVFGARRARLDLVARALERQLRERLVHDDGIATSVNAGVLQQPGGDRFLLTVDLQSLEQSAAAERVIAAQLRMLRTSALPQRYLRLLRQQASWRFLLGLEGLVERARALALERLHDQHTLDFGAYAAELGAVTAADLTDTARELLPSARKLVLELAADPHARPGGEVESVRGNLFGE